MKIIYSIILFCLIAVSSVNSQQLPSKTDIISAMKLVNDYWINTHTDPGNNGWDRATYFTGNMEFYNVYPDKKYLNYAQKWAENYNWGLIGGTSTRHADNQCAGQVYIDLYEMDTSQAYKIADITTSVKSMVDGTKSDDWWWIDALYMAMPVFTRLGVIHDDTTYFNKLYALYSNTKQTRGLYNNAVGLWYRDGSFKPPYQTPNGFNSYWSRGNGWVIAAHVRTLQHLPETDSHRAEYINTFKDMAAALKDVQRADGFWNVSLADPNDYGGPETSGTSFFTYSIAWGINNGFLDSSTYYPVIAKAWEGLTDTAVHENGKLGWVQGVGSNPASSQPVTYETTTDFGVGAFLLAGSELLKMATGTMPSVPYHLVDSIKLIDRNTLEAYFNEVIKENNAEDTSNYIISDGIKVRRATLSEDGKKVTLNLSTLLSGSYTISFNNIESVEGHVMDSGYQENFAYNPVSAVYAIGYEAGSTNYPENTTDGNLNTRWSQEGDNQWILFKLESIDTVTSVDVAFYVGDQRVTYIDIEVSLDSVTFTQVYSGESGGATLELENFEFPDTAVQYVKIVGHGNSKSAWNSLTEVVINVVSKPEPELPEIIEDINETYTAFNKELIVYPNPLTGNILNINTSGYQQKNVNVVITDITGKQVYNNIVYVNGYEPLRLNVNLTKGMYIVVVAGDGIAKNAKIIVK